jgi:hypothetical protein
MQSTTYLGRTAAVLMMAGTALAFAGCSHRDENATRASAYSPQPYTSGSETRNGEGTAGGTQVDGADPAGPRNPNRYTTPNPVGPSPDTYVAPDGTVHRR